MYQTDSDCIIKTPYFTIKTAAERDRIIEARGRMIAEREATVEKRVKFVPLATLIETARTESRQASGPVIETETYHSEIFNETYTLTDSGEVLFTSGIRYTRREVDLIKKLNMTAEDKRRLHYVKSMFDGEILSAEEFTKLWDGITA